MTCWGMVVDLRKCIGCETCKHVCNDANHVPPGATWRRVVSFTKDKSLEKREYLSMGCMHCSDPPCLEVCPTGASYRRPDGLVDIRNERCIGCGACIMACPYKARSITFEDTISSKENIGQGTDGRKNFDRIGVCTKCDFCLSRLEAGLKKGLEPGSDTEAMPICVRYCIGEALYFGDLDDPESEVSKLIRENRASCLNEELQTHPGVYYIF
jgi:phenylacetyl-CoA:acceptor oxidoreductase subunit 1